MQTACLLWDGPGSSFRDLGGEDKRRYSVCGKFQLNDTKLGQYLNWCVPLCLRRLVRGSGSRWPRPDGFLRFFRDFHHSIFGFLQPCTFLSRSFITPANLSNKGGKIISDIQCLGKIGSDLTNGPSVHHLRGKRRCIGRLTVNFSSSEI